MGPIQASLNQLTLSTLGAIGGVAHGIKGTFAKPKAPATQKQGAQPTAETESSMGNIAKIGKNYSMQNIKSYEAAARSVESGNDAIRAKAKAHFDPIAARLNEVNKTIASFATAEKEVKK